MNKILTSTLIAASLLSACGEKNHTHVQQESSEKSWSISNFEQGLPTEFDAGNTKSSLVNKNAPEGKQALRIDFSSDELRSDFSFKAKKPWDWSQYGNINLAADIHNLSDESIQIYLEIKDATGWPHIRSVSIPAGYTGTYYALLKGPQLELDSGLREDPKTWQSNDHKMFWMRGAKQLKLDQISSINFFVESMKNDKSLLIDNLRVRQNPDVDANYLKDLTDAYGQSYKFEYPTKVKSDEQLKALADAEIAQLNQQGTMADRSQFGGWASGPKLKATGYFRTEKVNGKWAIVDPEGHLFFSSALANIRIANTTTFTGVDFKDDSVRYIDPEDVTPEDSLGIRPVSKEAQKTRYVSSEMRHKMFTWLPDYDHDLANHYSYRRSSHKGPLSHGETYSFYQANLERRYGEDYPDSYLDAWRDITIKRFKNWGFTSTGNWTDASFYQMNQVPYFANGWIIGDFKTVSSGQDVWSRMPDPFDPEFKRRAIITAKVIGEEIKNNPWCIGIFVDNEKSWGNNSSLQKRYGIVLNTLTREDSDSPLKAKISQMMQAKYPSIKALNTIWKTDIESWASFSKGISITDLNAGVVADLADMSFAYANEYFKIVHDALADVAPNHMYMGVRMAAWGLTTEAANAAAQYADIMSYNFYREYAHPKAWEFLADLDKPSLIGEFHMGATSDTGLYHPGLILAADQQDRAQMYKDYMYSIIDNPYMVGAHWFQYLDSPLTGRAHDGENYNTGFVTITDVPYQEMVNAAKEVNANLYQRKFGNGQQN
ncbi:agarase [Catenovulum maritimum]|uniref:Agarase n=1 Tax=Catenovulum maritimum TaxID=1513271 RepID=A0A0J8JH57_9ALTE|nr:agarase [Catenovulum maritimum]AYW35324.1 agarase Q7 [Catenovulum maritimum]KMT63726.1 agarase [Catenovulum maritimum]